MVSVSKLAQRLGSEASEIGERIQFTQRKIAVLDKRTEESCLAEV